MSEAGHGSASQGCGLRLNLTMAVGLLSMSHSLEFLLLSIHPYLTV